MGALVVSMGSLKVTAMLKAPEGTNLTVHAEEGVDEDDFHSRPTAEQVIFEDLLHPGQLANRLCAASHPPMALARPAMIQDDPITEMRVRHTEAGGSSVSEFARNLGQARRRLLI